MVLNLFCFVFVVEVNVVTEEVATSTSYTRLMGLNPVVVGHGQKDIHLLNLPCHLYKRRV